MASAKLERTSIDLQSLDKEVTLRANGQVVLFDGFLKVYEESNDDAEQSEDESRLPQMSKEKILKSLVLILSNTLPNHHQDIQKPALSKKWRTWE